MTFLDTPRSQRRIWQDLDCAFCCHSHPPFRFATSQTGHGAWQGEQVYPVNVSIPAPSRPAARTSAHRSQSGTYAQVPFRTQHQTDRTLDFSRAVILILTAARFRRRHGVEPERGIKHPKFPLHRRGSNKVQSHESGSKHLPPGKVLKSSNE